jgi:hypothetical protein
MEKLGLRAGIDPLRTIKPIQESKPIEVVIPKEVKDLYANMGKHIITQKTEDILIKELVSRDKDRSGFLNED